VYDINTNYSKQRLFNIILYLSRKYLFISVNNIIAIMFITCYTLYISGLYLFAELLTQGKTNSFKITISFIV
jgi:hypothetical protein